jgi:hypothetical protein
MTFLTCNFHAFDTQVLTAQAAATEAAGDEASNGTAASTVV